MWDVGVVVSKDSTQKYLADNFLGNDEIILWSGKSSLSASLWGMRGMFIGILIYTLIVCVWYFGNYSLIFILVWLMSIMAIGNFLSIFKALWLAVSTAYFVTNVRIFVVRKGFNIRVRSIFPQDFNGVEVSPGRNGKGTIRLTLDEMEGGKRWFWFGRSTPSSSALLEMVGVPEVGGAARSIEALKRAETRRGR